MIIKLRRDKENEEKRRAEMKSEMKSIKVREEELRKEKEADERRKKELEELAKRFFILLFCFSNFIIKNNFIKIKK